MQKHESRDVENLDVWALLEQTQQLKALIMTRQVRMVCAQLHKMDLIPEEKRDQVFQLQVSPLLFAQIYLFGTVHIYIHVCMYVCMYVFMHVCMYTYARRHVCMYVCMYVRTYKRTYVCMYVRTYVCMYVYKFVQTHMDAVCSSQRHHGIASYHVLLHIDLGRNSL
jgi:hypothetical protein